jgi:hypothetical protein
MFVLIYITTILTDMLVLSRIRRLNIISAIQVKTVNEISFKDRR